MTQPFKKSIFFKYWLVFFATLSNTAWLIGGLNQAFYVQFQEVFHLTNTQIGMLDSFGNIGGFIGGFVGGFLADKFSPKKLTALGSVLAGLVAIWEANSHSYAFLVIIYIILTFTTNVLLSAPYFKLLKLIGTNKEQGKIMTFSETSYAIVIILGDYGFLALISAWNLSFQTALICLGLFCIIIGICIQLFYKEEGILKEETRLKELKRDKKNLNEPKNVGHQKTNFIADYIKVLKMPILWLNVFASMSISLLMQFGLTYSNPYLVNVLGFSAGFASFILIGMKNGLRIIISPFGGIARDKFGDSTVVLKAVAVPMIICAVLIAVLPFGGTFSAVCYFILIFLVAVGIYLVTGLQYTLVEDAKVPVKYVGRVWGVMFLGETLSHVFRGYLCGRILDTFGNNGFRIIYLFLAASAVSCLIIALITHKVCQNKTALGMDIQAEADADINLENETILEEM